MTPEDKKRWPWAQEMVGSARQRFGDVPSAGQDVWSATWSCRLLERRDPDRSCWCLLNGDPGTVSRVLTYDDWGDGPMCVMCGRLKEADDE